MNCNSDTEEETIAVNKKRARRVSFAENTSVHIFDRDEESESPTGTRTNLTDVNPTELGLFHDELGFRRNSIDANDILRNDDEDDEDDNDSDPLPSFFRPIESPSSGSAFGSATSSDEDNFFGPVSASFIRPGLLSDSAPYDDNHEVTMDSTAFSMNFRSLAKSDSGADLMTSTGVRLTFDEKTPTLNSNPTNQGSTMVLTVPKRPNLQSSSRAPAKSRSNSDSNDMSLVGEISRRYDYGGLSPGLDELLAQTSKDMHASSDSSYLESVRNIKSGLAPTSNHGLTSSVVKIIEVNSSTLPTYQGTQSEEESALRGDATADNESLSQHGIVQSCLASVHRNHPKGSPVAENLDGGNIDHPDYQGNYGTIKDSPTPLEHRASHIIQSRTPNKDSETERGQTKAKYDMAEEGGEDGFRSSNVSFSQKSANDPSIRKNLGKLFAHSPSGVEEQNVIRKGKLSPGRNQVKTNIENSTRKRSNEGVTLQDENTKSQKNPKLCVGGRDPEVSEPLNGGVSEGSASGHEFKHWVEIQSKISEVTKNLLSLAADELSLQSIDALEDVLVGLLRKQKYKLLCADMQSQKKHYPVNNHQHKRVAEAKLLLHKLVQEKAKLQLMRAKRDISLKRVQVMRSRVQECEMLRSNHLMLHPQKTLHVQADVLSQCLDDRQLQYAHDNVTALRQVLEVSERRLKKLTESFLFRCKIRGKPDSADAVLLVNDYLTKRACRRNLRLDVQMWDIDHLENKNGHCTIFLKYLSFITQRLHVTLRPMSVLSISYELNYTNIVKDLPCVDARTAFAYVFDAEPTRKYVSSRSLAEETQISSSLLGNMLDVVEEVQSAQLELPNLVQCTFCSESVDQLNLQLHFINLKSGKRAIFTFDLSCLKRGVYPSEIIPFIMEAPADNKQKFCSEQLFAEVRAAVQSLRVGYLRIIRACRCISQVVGASNC